METKLKNKLKENLPLNVSFIEGKSTDELSCKMRLAESEFYQTEYSVCEYPYKKISKLLVVK